MSVVDPCTRKISDKQGGTNGTLGPVVSFPVGANATLVATKPWANFAR